MRSSLNHVDYADTDLERDDRKWMQSSVTMKILMQRSLGAFFENKQGESFSWSDIGY